MKLALLTILFFTFSIYSYSQSSDYLREIERNSNAAFYIRGTPKELRKAGILKRKGGIFFGWMLGLELNEKYVPDINNGFQKIHRLETTTISGGPKRVKQVYPKRNYNSYRIKGNQLIITDPYSFWNSYKFVIISAK